MFRNAYAILFLTALFWGGNAVAGKLAIGHVSPMLLTALRWAAALAVLIAIGWRQFAADWPVLRRNWLMLAGLGTIGFSIFNLLFYVALVFTSAINVSIEQAGMPMAIFLANFLLFRLRVGGGQIVGLLLSMVGIALTASHGDLTDLLKLQVNFGDGLMLVAVILYSAYSVALRFKPDLHWKSLMIALSAAATVTSLPFAALEYAYGAGIWPDAQGWAVVAYTAAFPSIVSQVFYIRGVELIGANRAGLFINLVPILGTFLAILILGEPLHAYHAIALALVLGGIWLAEHSGRRMAGLDS